MKRISVIFLLTLILSTSLSASAAGWDISDLLGKVSPASADSTKTSAGSSKGGNLGGLLSGVANALGLGSSNLTVDKMVGTWNYTNPAVSFKSDNFLLKAGGAAAAQQIESELARMANLTGTIEKNAETGNFIFNFKAFKKIKIGSMEAFIVMNGNKMELTFDVSKLMTIVEKAGSLTGNSTIKGLSTLLQQYDGLTAGFELQRKSTN